jgi:hypothetical protein
MNILSREKHSPQLDCDETDIDDDDDTAADACQSGRCSLTCGGNTSPKRCYQCSHQPHKSRVCVPIYFQNGHDSISVSSRLAVQYFTIDTFNS